MNLSLRELRVALLVALAVGLLLRLAVVGSLGFANDILFFQAQAERLRQVGPADFYSPGFFNDYPPAYLSLLGALAWLLGGMPAGVFKASSIPFDLAIAVTLYLLLRRLGNERAGVVAAALYVLNPALIFAGPYWGQTDAAGTFPFLLALVALGFGRFGLAGAFAGLALMAKLQSGLAAVPIGAIALFALIGERRVGPLVRTVVGGGLAVLAFALPFRLDLFGLLGRAADTYPYTSLYVFNLWGVVGDFWKPDAQRLLGVTMQHWSALLFGLAVLATLVFLWRAAPWHRRFGSEPAHDLGLALAAGALLVFAFFFLPTRVHERYLFPAFAMLAPFAALYRHARVAYLALSVFFLFNLHYAFTRYPQNATRAPDILEATLYQRPGTILLALIGMGVAGFLAWRWWTRRDYVLVRERPAGSTVETLGPATPLPVALGPGRVPTRRDLVVALVIALAVLGTRGFRLDHPREMYFDEVYHARTAFELLAQREPYEWTHPHLAKELMAVGILVFGGDRVVGTEPAPTAAPTAFTVSNDGLRAYGLADGTIELRERGGSGARQIARLDGAVRQLSFDGASLLYAVTDRSLAEIAIGGGASPRTREISGPAASFAVSAGRAIVGTSAGVHIYALGGDARPVVVPIPVTALTAKPDGSEIYVVDPLGVVHVVDPASGRETARPIAGGAPASAIAYSRTADRIFTARAGEAALDWFEPPRTEAGGRKEGTYIGRIALQNARTGDHLGGPVGALAVVPRTGFLYALTVSQAVVVETVGGSPFAAIRVFAPDLVATATAMGIDGTDDKLLVAPIGPLPLGGLTISPARDASVIETGRHALAWRLPGILFAAILAFFLVLLARRLFASAVLPVLVGLAVLLDGAMFAQARIGMNDVYVGTLIVVGWYFVVAAHRPRRSAALDLLIAGAVFGLALATKWVAAYAVAGVGLAALAATARAYARGRPGSGGPLDLLRPVRLPPRVARGVPERLRRFAASEDGALSARIPLHAAFLALCFGAIPLAIYLAGYVRWFGGPTAPYGWDLVELTRQMYWYHSSLTAPHPAGSPWWSWPLVLKPVYWYLGQSSGNDNAYIYDAGNIVLFWGGIAAIAWCAVAAVRARSVALGFVVFALLTQYVAWIPISRVLFFYHFFTALPFYLLGLAAALAVLWESGRRTLVAGFLALAAGVFVFFYPFVSGQPVASDQAAMFFILPTWQYGCQFYPSFNCAVGPAGDVPTSALAGRLTLAAGAAALAALAFALARDDPRRRLRAILAGRGWRVLQG